MTVFSLMIGAFFGAIARFGVNQVVKSRTTTLFPWATFFVNVSGSLGLGYLVAAESPKMLFLGLGVGFLGSFTTFSTFKLEVIEYASKDWIKSLLYLILTYIGGILAAMLGYIIG